MLNPILQVGRLIGKLTCYVAVTRNPFQAGTNLAVRANNTRNSVATTAPRTIEFCRPAAKSPPVGNALRGTLQAVSISERKQTLSRILALPGEGVRVGGTVTLTQP
jgi:hypothetical protein